MKGLKNFFLISIIVLIIINFTGCWNYRETNNLGLVAGVAIDKDINTNKYILTTEILDFVSLGGGESRTISKIFVTEGETAFDSVRDILMKKGEKPYWAHTKILILSKDIAENEILPIIDYMSRDAEIRGNIKLLISKEDTAGEVLIKKGKKDEEIVSFNIDQAIEFHKSLAKYPVINMWEFIDAIGAEGSSPIVTSIDKTTQNDKEMFRIYGCYAFKNDRAVGWLNSKESKGVLFVKDEIKGGLIQVEGEINGVRYKNDLEIFRSKTKIEPIYKNNKVALSINVEIDVGIGAIGGNVDFMEENNRKLLQKTGEKLVKESIERVIFKAQNNFNSDIFGFSGVIHREMPEEWKKIKPNWQEEFRNLYTMIDVKINITGAALNSKPIKLGEAK